MTRVYLFPFMVSYKIIIFCMKIHGTIDINAEVSIESVGNVILPENVGLLNIELPFQ